MICQRIYSTVSALLILMLVCGVGMPMPCLAQSPGQNAAYHAALNNLKALEESMSPEEKVQIPSCEAVLHRVFYEYDQATPSEIQLVSIIITGDPNALDNEATLGSKGLSDGLPQLLPLRYRFVPIIAISQSTHYSARRDGSHHHATALHSQLSIRRQEHYVRPLHACLTRLSRAGRGIRYRSAVLRQPGGKTNGVVEMEQEGQRIKIVEIPTGTTGLGLAERAERIADRLRNVQDQDATWWTRIRPGQINGEEVVELPSSRAGTTPFLVTADQNFATEWGLTPKILALRLVRTIRNGIEQTRGGKALTNNVRQQAISCKQKGDDAYTTGDYNAAEQQYCQSMDADPSYAIAYQLLISLYKEQKQPDKVKEVVGKALGAPLTDTQMQAIQAAATAN